MRERIFLRIFLLIVHKTSLSNNNQELSNYSTYEFDIFFVSRRQALQYLRETCQNTMCEAPNSENTHRNRLS